MHSWDEVLVNQGEVLNMVSTTRLHAPPPPPPGQQMQGALFTQCTPDTKHPSVR